MTAIIVTSRDALSIDSSTGNTIGFSAPAYRAAISARLIAVMYPLRSKTTYTETINDEVCVYEWTRHEVHALNATAASVWQLCDGRTRIGEMVDRLRPRLPDAEHVVALALEEFQKNQLLDVDLGRTSPVLCSRGVRPCGLD